MLLCFRNLGPVLDDFPVPTTVQLDWFLSLFNMIGS